MRILAGVVVVVLLIGCSRKDETPLAAGPAPAPAAKPPVRTAVEDSDLREMLAEMAAAKACTMMEGQFRGLRDKQRPEVVTGVLWIRGCRITHKGTKLDFHFTGDGWQWAEGEKHKAGATFRLRDYLRFSFEITVAGALDISYSTKTHVASLWFTPSRRPDIEFEPLGELDVDPVGTWSSVLGALASTFASSPEELASGEADRQGTQEIEKQFAEGLSVTIDLCTGYSRFGLGRPGNGKMAAPDVGETRKVPVELQPGAVIVFGPQLVLDDGITVHVHVEEGAVRAELACHEQGEALARAFTREGLTPSVKSIARKDISDEGTLRLRRSRCPIAVVFRTIGDQPARFDWQRPMKEAAAGPLVRCAARD
jgi:hypothetical protein